jgi:translation initiation factor 1
MQMGGFDDLDIVFSTDHGRIKPQGKKPDAQKGDGIVRVGRETKGRKGKGMTVITGVPLHPEGLKDLAKTLKQKCGTGGTVKGRVIEIQGDHRDLLVAELQAFGYVVKKAGG